MKELLMMRTFSLTLFRFDLKTDYLPYVTKYSFDYDDGATFGDLLNELKAKDTLVGIGGEGARVNGFLCGLETPLMDIVSRLGLELYIEPLSTKRAVKDLQINKDDFLERFDLLAPYVQKSDREFFQTLVLLHYATPALKYNSNILGSAFYYFSAKMIQKYPNFEAQIAEIASEPNCGVQYHLPLELKLFNPPEDLEEQIGLLIQAVHKHFPDRIKKSIDLAKNPVQASLESFLNATSEDLSSVLLASELKHDFSNFKAGVYLGSEVSMAQNMEASISFSRVKPQMLASKNEPDGSALFVYDSSLACKMAGEILLEAYDSGCDFLLVDNHEYLTLFDKEQKACAKAVGRAINLPIITAEQLALIALGEIEKSGILSHTCKANFLPA